jgi:dipeptidyl-peptidase-4
MAIPNTFTFSPDDRRLTYLAGSGIPPVQSLWTLDLATGARTELTAPDGGTQEDRLSAEEELRRQRERRMSVGISAYSRAERGERVLVPLGGDIYVADGPGAPLHRVFDHAGGEPAQTPTFSPDGERIAFVRDGEVYVVAAAGDEPAQVTHGARATGTIHGLAEFVAQEELDREEGFWWSPDGRRIAFEEFDERHIPVYRIVHQGADDPDGAFEDHHYPFAGRPNVHVRLGVATVDGGEPVWMDLGGDPEAYLARAFWWRDGHLGAIMLNRPQTRLELLRLDPTTGARSVVLREDDAHWINLPKRSLHELGDGRFVWSSERTGFQHLYLYHGDGTLARPLTEGAWAVDDVAGVDEAGGQVYFTAARQAPTEKRLYAAPLAGGPLREVTPEPGAHDVTLDHAHQRFVDVHSALDRPPTVTLRALVDGTTIHTIHSPDDPRLAHFQLEPPELVRLPNREGTTLYGAIYRPPARFGPGPYPTIVSVYGGPGPQLVANRWDLTAALQTQYLRDLGYLVFRLDNRGSARRGMAFESAITRRMGTVEVDDQVDGVRWLVARGLADPKRVGITGWSYGGYMSLLCLAKAPETFKVAVAGAPVTAYDGYDTTYTERYMGTPTENPEGYREGSVLAHVDRIQGKLLLIHGLLDENVHFRHTARLIAALIRAGKPHDLLLLPEERHSPRRRASREYLQRRTVEFFQTHL